MNQDEVIADNTVETTPETQSVDRYVQGQLRVRDYTMMSMTTAIIPVPLFDVAALTALQLKMIQQLTALYDLPFNEKLVRNLLTSLLGNSLSTAAGIGVGSLLKSVPGVGSVAGIIGTSTLGGATTYAIGNTFVNHFEQGGTLADFDAANMRARFSEQLAKGRGVAQRLAQRLRRSQTAAEPTEVTIESLREKIATLSTQLDQMLAKQTQHDTLQPSDNS